MLIRSNISSFPQYFEYILNISLTKESNYIFICEMWLFNLFFQFCKSDKSTYGYLEVFAESTGLRDNESNCIREDRGQYTSTCTSLITNHYENMPIQIY